MEKPSTLEDDLRAQGEDEAVLNLHQDLNCGRWLPAFALTNVKDNDHWPEIDYVCGHCIMDFRRQLNRFVETLAKAVAPRRDIPSPDEIVAEKRRILSETIWATAEDGTVSQVEARHWGEYRRAVAAVDPNNFPGWPDRPEI